MAIVHLLRHGHVHNPEGVLYGRLPEFRLSEAGEQMAHAVAAHLKAEGRDVGRVVASPLLRAQQTAQAVAEAYGLEVETDARLIEAGNVYEGERIRSGVLGFLHPRHWWRLRNPFRPSWGEPYTEQRDRMRAAVLAAAEAQPHRDSVLVSHQLPIWVMRLTVERRRYAHDPRSRECALCSLTTLKVDGDRITLAGYQAPAAHIQVPG